MSETDQKIYEVLEEALPLLEKWANKQGGIAVYECHALDSARLGERQFMPWFRSCHEATCDERATHKSVSGKLFCQTHKTDDCDPWKPEDQKVGSHWSFMLVEHVEESWELVKARFKVYQPPKKGRKTRTRK